MTPTPDPSATSSDRRSSAARPAGLRLTLVLWAGTLSIFILSGCAKEFTCVDLGCDPGEVCNRSSGQCEPETNDCTETGCPPGEVCNEKSGQCRPLSCPDQPCPDGQECNTEQGKGFCQAIPDCKADGCASPAETCESSTGRCVPTDCERDTECPRGYVCSEESVCRSGCRVDAPNCPPQTFCRPVSGSSTGQCLPECNADRECPYGQFCPTGTEDATCQPEPPCSIDRDCRSDEICRNEQCVAPPCTSAEDCTSDRVCDRATGLCVGADCQEDALSPNQSRETAAALGFDNFTGLSICRGRADWFKIDVDSSQAVTVRLEHDAGADLDLLIYDRFGRVLGAAQQKPPPASSGRFAESTTVFSDRSQPIYLYVYTTSRESDDEFEQPIPSTGTYELAISRADDAFCSDDDYEENDHRDDSSRLPSNAGGTTVFKDFQICGGDTDWFRLPSVTGGSRFEARLIDSPNHLALTVLSSTGAEYELSPGEQLDLLRVGETSDWFLRVHSRKDLAGSYGLTYGITGPWECPEAGQHDDIEDAIPIESATDNTFELCPHEGQWEIDWLGFDSPDTESQLELVLEPNRDVPDLDVTLYEERPSGLQLLRRAAQTHDGTYKLALQTPPDQSLLLRVSASGPVGLLESEPRYSVDYEFVETMP